MIKFIGRLLGDSAKQEKVFKDDPNQLKALASARLEAADGARESGSFLKRSTVVRRSSRN